MLLSEIIAEARPLLNDTAGGRWPDSELVQYCVDGERAVVQARQELISPTLLSATLVAGVQQNLVASVEAADKATYGTPFRLLDVTRTQGGTIIERINRTDLDRQVPTWPALTSSVAMRYWMQDERDELTWYCCPARPAAPGKVYLRVAFTPKDKTSSDPFQIGDEWRSAIVNYVLGTAYLKDDTFAVSPLSGAYLQRFDQAIGLEDGSTARTLQRRQIQEGQPSMAGKGG